MENNRDVKYYFSESASNIKNATNAPREMPVRNVTQKRLVIDFLQQLIQLPVPRRFNAVSINTSLEMRSKLVTYPIQQTR